MIEIADDDASTVPANAAIDVSAVAPAPRPDAPIVIVGSGHAGYSAAAAIRAADPEREMVLFTADDGRNYYKPSLSNALARGHDPAVLVRETAHDVGCRLGVHIHAHCRVHAIDRNARAVDTDLGRQPYDRLVLALGAEPVKPPLAGDGAAEVLSVNDLADYERFRARLHPQARVTVIGNGLIGCEFANDLAAAGHAVAVIGLTGWPLDPLLPKAAAMPLQAALADRGVEWYLQRTVTEIARDGDGYRLTLSDAQVLAADVVLSAVGLRPRTGLAAAAGLEVGKGVCVDRALRTSDPAIHAVGDCVELDNGPQPFIAPIDHSVGTLAANVLGRPQTSDYPPMPVTVKTPAHPVVILPPPSGTDGTWQVVDEGHGVRAVYEDGAGHVLGFALTGRMVRERRHWMARCGEDRNSVYTRVA
ncbi:FAD-dependent oxidoreductase [Arhodomonas aquaeolei]|nr:FAD-dependent oxidoreductase [Arhodomonas aquaeolei]